ncbi:MAG: collagen-like protein, partial [Candidatus Nanoarchaeia archaeon]|nr:collagen-like protein [Candidatus Nanoarchaeia archaeon]
MSSFLRTNEQPEDSRAVGVIEKPSYIDNHDGSIVVSQGVFYLRNNPDNKGPIVPFVIPEKAFTLTNKTMQYVVAYYNSGNPEYQLITYPERYNYSNNAPAFVFWRVDNEIYSIDYDQIGYGMINKVNSALSITEPYRLKHNDFTSLIVTETETPNPRTVVVSGGDIFALYCPLILNDFNSSVDRLTLYYHVGGVWQQMDTPQYNNTQYDDGTNLQTINDNYYSVRWFFRSISVEKHVFYILGTNEYEQIDDAKKETLSINLPYVLQFHCKLVGRSIIQYNATSGLMESTLRAVFSSGSMGETGLQGDTGLEGLQGDTGVQGHQGDTGLEGLQGNTGLEGLQGDTGVQGLQGDTGLEGLQGNTGLEG